MESNGGGMTTRDRFEHIDAALLRIEAKLDGKSDVADLRAIDDRVRLLEAGETPLSKMLLKQFADTSTQVAELTLHGSNNAQELTHKVEQLQRELIAVRTDREAFRTVQADRAERQDRALRIGGALLAMLTTMAVAASAIATVLTLTAHP